MEIVYWWKCFIYTNVKSYKIKATYDQIFAYSIDSINSDMKDWLIKNADNEFYMDVCIKFDEEGLKLIPFWMFKNPDKAVLFKLMFSGK